MEIIFEEVEVEERDLLTCRSILCIAELATKFSS